MNTQVSIAFTWPWNTGKSTIIKQLEKELSKEFGVSTYNETARDVLDKQSENWIDFNMSEFQNEISKLESQRIDDIKNDISEILLLDRTSVDWLVYSMFNRKKWYSISMNQEAIWDYDMVILFTEEFKKTNTEQFSHYNDNELVDLFRMVMNYMYKWKVVEFNNASDYEEILEEIKVLYYSKSWESPVPTVHKI